MCYEDNISFYKKSIAVNKNLFYDFHRMQLTPDFFLSFIKFVKAFPFLDQNLCYSLQLVETIS